MNFEPDEDAQSIREAIRQLCSKFDDRYWRECDEEHRFPSAFYAAMAEGHWIGVAIPEEYGGAGRGITEASVILEEVAASGAAMNGATAIHLSIFGMNPVVKHGSDQLKRKYLPRVASGDLHVAFGVTEPDAGTDTTAITTQAVRHGDKYTVRGRKVWTSKALESEKVLLLVRTTPLEQCARRTDGMTLLLADLQRPEVDIRAIPKAGRNAVASCEVRYDDLSVDVSDRVGEEGQGFRYLLDGLNPERILIASEALGVGRAALRKAVGYARSGRSSDGRSARTRASLFPWPKRTHASTPPSWRSVRRPGATTPVCPAASKRISPSGWPPKPAGRPPTKPSRRTAGSATQKSTTSSATGARFGSCALHRCRRRWS